MDRKTSAMARRALDRRLAEAVVPELPAGGWIRAAREALGMSAVQLAARIGVTRQAIGQFEQGELEGSIELSTLRRAAESLGCRFVYALVPTSSFEEIVAERARRVASTELAAVDQTMLLEGQRVEREQAHERLEERAEELIGSRRLWST